MTYGSLSGAAILHSRSRRRIGMNLPLTSESRLSSRGLAILLAVTLAGLSIRIAYQVGRPFVGDEIGSLAILGESYTALLTTFKGQLTMNAYLALLKALHGAFGNSAWALVAPSLLAGTATIVLVAYLVRRVASEKVALVAAFLTALNPALIFYSVRIRSYMLFVAFALAAVLALYAWMDRRSWKRGLLCALFSVLALLAHANAVYQMGFIGVLFAIDTVRRRQISWSFVVPMGVAALVVIAAYLPLRTDMAEFHAMWSDTPPTSWGFLPDMLTAFFDAGWALVLTLALAARGLWTASQENRRLAGLGLGILVPLILVSLLGVSHYPWTYSRFLLPVLPLLIAFIAQGVGDLTRGSASGMALVAAVVATSWSPALRETYAERREHPYDEVAEFLIEQRVGRNELLTIERATGRHLSPYLPGAVFASVDELLGDPLDTTGPQRLFVVSGDVPIMSDTARASSRRFGSMQVLTYEAAAGQEHCRQLLADLTATLQGRIDPDFADHYAVVMDLMFRFGQDAELAKASVLYYESQLRTKRQRGTPAQLLERSTSSRLENF
jgi:hypothetical protein